ncbi:metallophosphoesterase [uncultured Jatrophihabitans sp.]|uniref:metallophosphoesterase n=1 Tax=uncultured Jatrophihabitans sp. TaxID=1610747 RepID=UPI0035C9AFB6
MARPISAPTRTLAGIGAAGAGAIFYGTVIERNAFVLRHFDVPVLTPGSAAMRVLHVSDLHITARQRRKQDWIRGLAELQPDLVINTGDTLSALDAIPAVMHALEPLFAFPGAFVPGNNDYWAPRPKNPARYFQRPGGELPDDLVPLPWPTLARAMAGAGWEDLTHVRTTVTVNADNASRASRAAGAARAAGAVRVALAGTDDPHLGRARYVKIAGAADPDADVRIGVIHSPEPRLLAAFAADGYDLLLAGHTHGGQVRIPFGPPLVTNCGIDRARARWLHQWDGDGMYFHICAGLGTNPYSPIRFCCRPEATLLTLTPRP